MLATRLGLQTGQARLGAVRAFLGARQTVQRRSSFTLSGIPTAVRRPPTGLPRPVNQVHKLHTLSGAGETRGQSPSFLATRLGLQTGQARLGAVRGNDAW